jgi:hypothetical protein
MPAGKYTLKVTDAGSCMFGACPEVELEVLVMAKGDKKKKK